MVQQHHDSPSVTTGSSSSPGSSSNHSYEGFDPELPEGGESKRFLGLSSVQIGASALAAVTSAVVASFFGVAGTLIGAAVGSIISTVGGAMYAESMRRAGNRLRDAQTMVIQRIPRDTETRPTQLPPAVQQPETQADVTRAIPIQADDAAQQQEQRARPWWRRPLFTLPIVGISGFVIAIALITGVEGLTGKTLSGGTGTSLSKIGGTKSSSSKPVSTATVTVTTTATPDATVSTTTPQSTVPVTVAPSTGPTASVTGSPSATSTAAPTVTASPDASSGDASGGGVDVQSTAGTN